MPRSVFDVHDGGTTRDDHGTEPPDGDAVRRKAMQALPKIAADESPDDGDRRHFSVRVTVEDERAAQGQQAQQPANKRSVSPLRPAADHVITPS